MPAASVVWLCTSGGSDLDELCCPPTYIFLYCCTVTFIDDCSGNLYMNKFDLKHFQAFLHCER